MAATPGLVHQSVCAMSPEQIEAPIAEGKWSPRQIVAHMADCELAFSFRFRQILAEPVYQAQSFNQTAWAEHYASYDMPSALELFRAARGWNIKLIGGLSEADLQREMSHPERGTMTFAEMMELVGGHDLNHLIQLQTIAK
jgi:uncharacterized damage-inducible protein DinB